MVQVVPLSTSSHFNTEQRTDFSVWREAEDLEYSRSPHPDNGQ